jgi:hypothetical protein
MNDLDKISATIGYYIIIYEYTSFILVFVKTKMLTNNKFNEQIYTIRTGNGGAKFNFQ